MRNWFIFIVVLLSFQKSFTQECYIINYGEGNLQKKFINEIKKIKNPFCSNFNEIKITGDDIIDREAISHLKEAIVFCLTDNSAKFCKELKNSNVLGIFISKEIEYAKSFKVLSFYPDTNKFFNSLIEMNLTKLMIIFSSDSSEKAMYIFLKAKGTPIKIEPIKVEKPLDITIKISKVIKDYDGIIIPVDKTYFDKDLIQALVEVAHKDNKKLISFLDLFLEYGIDYSFQLEPATIAKETIELINKKEKTGLFELSEIAFKEKKGVIK